MKLKNKVLLSFMSIAMLLSLFAFVDMCAGYANKFVETRMSYKGEPQITDLEYSLASTEKICKDYIVTESDGEFIASYADGVLKSASLQELISDIEDDGVKIRFEEIKVYENLNFTKSVIIGGTLYVDYANINTTASELIIDGLDLYITSGSLYVKSGSTEMLSGKIISESRPAVVLDYNASSTLVISGGEIYASTTDAAIVSSMGSVKISGGKISNSFGYAIRNEASLTVSGEPEISGFEFDIKTNKPITLSNGVSSLKSKIKVLYDKVFERGTKTPVFRLADADSLTHVTMYDSYGEKVELTFFDHSEELDESSFLAVYLPYSVKFYNEGELYTTEYFLRGAAVSAPKSPTKVGYVFDGWYTDSTLKDSYNFGMPESFDFLLFAKFTLMPPEFEINSKSLVYDRKEYNLSFDKLYHPLSESGSFSFEWFKNSVPISYSSMSVPITNVLDSGVYKCKLTFSYNGDFVSVMTPDVEVLIEKSEVTKPRSLSYFYTGENVFPSFPISDLYLCDFSAERDVGIYPVTFTLKDFDNYKWKDSETRYTTSTYEILKAENEFLSMPIVKDCFVGSEPAVMASVKFGEIKKSYSVDGVNYSDDVPILAGEYFLKVTVPESENYFSLESEILKFKIIPEIAVGIKLDRSPDKTNYYAFETINLDGAEFSVTYNSGRVEKIDNSQLEIRYKTGNCFLAEDTCATAFFENVSVPVTVNISLAEYDMSGIVFESANVVYNGRRQSLIASGEVIGKDGYPLIFKVTGGGINAGEYTVTLSFSGDSLNYKIPAPIHKKLIISPFEAAVVFSNLEFTYDGTPKAPTATASGAAGITIPLSVIGVKTDAGVYTAKAILSDSNYILKNSETNFEILKANLDFSGVKWNTDSFVYTGNPQSVTISGLPDNVSFIGYTNSTFTEAGEYTATATVHYDTKNYNAPEALCHTWKIIPADYDFSDCFFLDAEYMFDGEKHYPSLVGTLPVGKDGSKPEYSYSCGVTHVSEGRVKITVSFSTESKNYNAPSDIIAYVKINPKPINVIWSELNFVYDGKTHIPRASAVECEIKITGEASDSGQYTAKARTDNLDFCINNSEVVYVISKATNFWQITPSVGTQFEGRFPAPHAEAYSGEPVYSYYKDKALSIPISAPTSCGTYYVVASVPESRNYHYLSYTPIEFSIIKIVPVDLNVDIAISNLVAKNKLSDKDVSVYLINNDGSKTALSLSDINIDYQNGDMLFAKDNKLSFSYGSFKVSYEISVKKAIYDMSGVYWDKTYDNYSGDKVFAFLTGLPEGVSVKEYISNYGINAGEYKLSAVLNYDSENYYEPKAPDGKLTIYKKEVEIPELEKVIYDGSLKKPQISESELYKTNFTGAVHAGVYDVIFLLRDSRNYKFKGESVKKFEILKCPITAEVSENGKDYTLVSGAVYGDDELFAEFYIDNGMVYMKISNPDYELTVIPSEKSSDTLWIILLLILIAILTALAIWIFYKRRDAFVMVLSDMLGKTSKNATAERKEEAIRKESDVIGEKDPPLETLLAVDETHANSLITDSLAKNLVTDFELSIETEGWKKAIINIDTISENFEAGDTVDINKMKEKKLIPRDAGKIKVLARGVIDKPLTVMANSFSLTAVKMIALTGGSAKRTHTVRKK